MLDHVEMSNNAVGFRAQSANPAGTIDVTITNSNIAASTFNGLVANSPGKGLVQVIVDNTKISNNGGAGVRADGNAIIRMRNSVVTGNAIGSNLTGGAIFGSYGNNSINGNGSNGPDPTVIPLK